MSRHSSMAGPGFRNGSAYESNSRRSSMAGSGSRRSSTAGGGSRRASEARKRVSVMFRDSTFASTMSARDATDYSKDEDSEEGIPIDCSGRGKLWLQVLNHEHCK